MATLGTIIADFTTSLASAIAVGGTTATLQSATDDDGVALPAGRYFFSIDGSNAGKEHISCDLSGTSLTNINSVSRQGVETSGTVRAHRLGATVTITDYLSIKLLNDMLSGVATLDADVPLAYDAAPVLDGDWMVVTKDYVDGVAIAGAPDSSTTVKGITKLSVAAATASNPISVGDNDPRIAPNNYAASSAGTDTYAITLGVAPSAYAAGQKYTFKADVANTGAATLNVNSLGAVTIKKNVSEDLATGDIVIDQMVTVTHDGTNFQLHKPTLRLTPTTQVYTSSDTWTRPSGLSYAVVEVVGGGGGGGSASEGAAGGGGGGGYSKETLTASELGSTEAVTVGAGGAGSSNGNGSAGGTSSFGTLLQATGGSGSTEGGGSSTIGAAGGVGSGGDINIAGGGGGTGDIWSNNGIGGAGGGAGGSSVLGGGGRSASTGGNYGGGGGGGSSPKGGGDQPGAAGAAGIVIVTEYYN